MHLSDLIPFFDLECSRIKLAYVSAPAKKPTAAEKVDQHHYGDVKDWAKFEKDMGGKRFRKAVMAHPVSDEKLKRYVTAMGELKDSKKVVGVVPSRTSSQLYKIKEIGAGRLACSCKDWQYKHSHGGGDCQHIKELKQGMEKRSASVLGGLARGVALTNATERQKKERLKGKAMQENVKRLRLGVELLPVKR